MIFLSLVKRRPRFTTSWSTTSSKFGKKSCTLMMSAWDPQLLPLTTHQAWLPGPWLLCFTPWTLTAVCSWRCVPLVQSTRKISGSDQNLIILFWGGVGKVIIALCFFARMVEEVELFLESLQRDKSKVVKFTRYDLCNCLKLTRHGYHFAYEQSSNSIWLNIFSKPSPKLSPCTFGE